MKEIHWSQSYITFMILEIEYDDGSRQGWDYDCIQYPTLERMKLNMAADFADQRIDRNSLMIYLTNGDISVTADVELPEITGEEFVTFVFNTVEDML